jgi:hypothetical protein
MDSHTPETQRPQSRAAPRVSAGSITALRLFDIANAIDLVRAQALWSAGAREGARARLTATPPKAVSFGDPPLGLTLPPVTLRLGGVQQLDAQVTARLYVFGVVTLAVRVAADDLAWEEYAALVNAVDAEIGPQAASPLWQSMLDQLRDAIRPALDRPMAALLEEDYLVATVHAFATPVAASALGAEIDLAGDSVITPTIWSC